MARGATKHIMGILNDSQNTYGGDTLSTSIRERGSYPN